VNTTSTSRSLTGLTDGATYNYQVQTVCSGGTSAYSSASSFSTPVAPCNTTSGLSATSVTSNSATVSWSAVSGAASYNLQYKLSSSATWTTVNTTSTSRALTGLSASSTYNYQVQTVCNSSSSAYTVAASFTTSAAPSGCTDTYESNNSRTAAKLIPLATNISAAIGTSTDKDYFKFSTTSSQRNVKVTLTNLVFDYDLQLFRGSTRVATSSNGSNTPETIIYNTTSSATTYYAYVYGYNGAFSASNCYTLRAEISSSAFARLAGETEVTDATFEDEVVSVYPNPNNGSFTIRMAPEADVTEPIEVYNLLGQLVERIEVAFTKDHPTMEIKMSNLSDGIYFVRVFDGANYQSKRILVKN
jgi:hypothetical protein